MKHDFVFRRFPTIFGCQRAGFRVLLSKNLRLLSCKSVDEAKVMKFQEISKRIGVV